MNKQEFVEELRKRLSGLPQEEADKSIAYYEEVIADRMEEGEAEEDAVAAMGSINEVVDGIFYDQSFPTLVKTRMNESKLKKTNKTLWVVIVILTFPIWFPIAISLIVAALSVYIAIWCVIISLFVAEFSFVASGLGGIGIGISFLVSGNGASGLLAIGAGILLVGIALFLIYPIWMMSKGLVKLTGKFVVWLKSLFISNNRDEFNKVETEEDKNEEHN